MNSIRWINITWILSLIIFLVAGLFNYIIDPFHQYRVKTFYPIAFVSKLERYINPGFAKNYNYDSVILGSSTSENFVISNIQEVLNFQKTIKLCISGTSAYEESLMLQTALKHKKIKNVLYGLDPFLFWGNPNRIRHGAETFPFYLYDDNLYNDYKYIFSLDTVIKSLYILKSFFMDNQNGISYNYNYMYQWQEDIPSSHFSRVHMLKEWKKRKKSDLAYQPENSFDFYKKSFDINFLNLVKQYPETNFIIYFPPYSILNYKYEKEEKVFNERLKFKKYIVEVTQKLSNVKVYDFQVAKEVTHNLSNYHDLNHFHQKINRWILEKISKNKYRVNSSNIDMYIKRLKKQVNDYEVSNL